MLIFGACSTAQNSSSVSSEAKTEAASTTASSEKFDPYATENRYDISEDMFKKRSDVDYGKVLKDVTYYSSTAGDDKQCNILLPAGYDESQKYPVMYVFHGFGGSHDNQIDDDSYLTLLYGNMLHDGLAVPQITVNVDMYTDKQADKDSKSDEQLAQSRCAQALSGSTSSDISGLLRPTRGLSRPSTTRAPSGTRRICRSSRSRPRLTLRITSICP